jgi:hypothetical protein
VNPFRKQDYQVIENLPFITGMALSPNGDKLFVGKITFDGF